jgi:hypothetical protein
MTAKSSLKVVPESFELETDAEGTVTFAQFSSGQPTGLGSMVKSSGETYVGSWKNGEFQGIGIFKMVKDHSYIGEFQKGKPRGFGLLRKDNKLVNGEFDFEDLTGFGSYSKPDFEYRGYFVKGAIKDYGSFTQISTNTSYEGWFKNGEFHGEGKLRIANNTFIGMLSHNQRSGVGRQVNTDTREEYLGYWSSDQKEAFGRIVSSSDRIYTGELKRGEEEGIAVVEYKVKGYVYTGQITSGERNGVGKIEAPKYTYLGQWKQGKMQGLGIEYTVKGSTYFGNWENNKKNGIGEERGVDFNYKGEWKEGKPHGRGMMKTEEGSEVYVLFDEGQIVNTIDKQSIQEIERMLNLLNFESFEQEYNNKVESIKKQVTVSLQQLQNKMKLVDEKLLQEEQKLNEKLANISKKCDTILEEAKMIEAIVHRAREAFDKKGCQPRLTVEVNEDGSKPDQNNDDGMAESPILEEDFGKFKYDELDKQVSRLAQYERWLLKQTQRIKEHRKHRRKLTHEKDYSTKLMLIEEEDKVKKMFENQIAKLKSEIEDLQKENLSQNHSIEKLLATKKELEAYCSNIDRHNFAVTAENQALKEQAEIRELQFQSEKANLKATIKNRDEEIETLKEILEQKSSSIMELSEKKKELEETIISNQKSIQDINQLYIRALVEISALRISLEVRIAEKIDDSMKISLLNENIDQLEQDLYIQKRDRAREKEDHENQVRELNQAHLEETSRMNSEYTKKYQLSQDQIEKYRKQIRVLETGGEVNDTDEKIRLKELEDLKIANRMANQKIQDLTSKLEIGQIELENLNKMMSNKDKILKDVNSSCKDSELKINQLEEVVRSYQVMQKEWSDMKEALANNIKTLKDREQELKAELQSKKTLEKEEIKKRNEKLSRGFFNDNVKPKIIMGLRRSF